ncbi:MAG: PP2C family serine/threonine-protein phosphatase [Methylococcales bacterium]
MIQTNSQNNSGWQVVAASCCGTSHIKVGMPCQDAHCWQILPNSTLVAAVSDGAGSAPCADVGAIIASKTAVESVRSRLMQMTLPEEHEGYKALLIDAIQSARAAIEIEARERGTKLNDFAATLILFIAMPGLITAAQIGDGAAVAGDRHGTIHQITAPQPGKYINETTFVTSVGGIETAQIHIWQGEVTHVAVLSDGLQMLTLNMPEGTPHVPFFSHMFQFLSDVTDVNEAQAELNTFLSSSRVTERTDDDLTLLLAKFVI